MILDKIEHRKTYREQALLYSVLEKMAGITTENFPQERLALCGDKAFINPVTLVTKPESACKFEAHRSYADVHYIVEGVEKIVVSDISGVIALGAFDEKSDIGFYRGQQGTVCVLHPGEFLVCYPQDAHKVAILEQCPAPVKKLVGKILVR